MVMTARRFKAEEMLGWGLIDQIAEAAELRGAARALAQEIAENAPLALLATRQTLRAGLVDAVTAALVHEHAEQSILRQTADYAEGVSSVFERRPAKFLGR
jgi:enoyl-CoA hydratase/carnithine racemase